MRISMIAAIGENRELGKDNKLIFDIPEDMKFFRDTTRGHPVIMGRKTAEHLVEFYTKGPLPGRVNIIITRDKNYTLQGFFTANSIEAAIQKAKESEDQEVFVIGGAETYKLALPQANRLYLTIVEGTYDADAFFPEFPEFTNVLEERNSSGNGFTYTFKTLERE